LAIHIQYLKNMKASASMSVSIVRDGALWGLVACHHTSPKPVSYEIREVCKHVAQILSEPRMISGPACASRQHVNDYADSPVAASRAFADGQVKVQITPEGA
jgi:light-regulated signal transduction histidine kinase (bacteriophytochrome)